MPIWKEQLIFSVKTSAIPIIYCLTHIMYLKKLKWVEKRVIAHNFLTMCCHTPHHGYLKFLGKSLQIYKEEKICLSFEWMNNLSISYVMYYLLSSYFKQKLTSINQRVCVRSIPYGYGSGYTTLTPPTSLLQWMTVSQHVFTQATDDIYPS